MNKIQNNYLLKELSTFKIGGPAEYFISVETKEDLEEAWTWARENNLKITLLGGGSNILVSDKGVKGLVIKLDNKKFNLDNEEIICEASARVWDIAQLAADNSLTGIEWAIGIPGSIGGAVRGNAGAHGGSFDKAVSKVIVFNSTDNSWQEFNNEQCGFAYRHSIFKQKPEFIIWQIVLKLLKGDQEKINEAVKSYRQYRSECQPKEPSAGCIFKNLFFDDIKKANPDLAKEIEAANKSRGGKVGAGYLVEKLNLKGTCLGDAQVSEMHANFIVNKGVATAADVRGLVQKIKSEVKRSFNIDLEEEVQYLGDFEA